MKGSLGRAAATARRYPMAARPSRPKESNSASAGGSQSRPSISAAICGDGPLQGEVGRAAGAGTRATMGPAPHGWAPPTKAFLPAPTCFGQWENGHGSTKHPSNAGACPDLAAQILCLLVPASTGCCALQGPCCHLTGPKIIPSLAMILGPVSWQHGPWGAQQLILAAWHCLCSAVLAWAWLAGDRQSWHPAQGWELKVPGAAPHGDGVLSTHRFPCAGAEPHLGGQWGVRPSWSSISTTCLLLVALARAPQARIFSPGECSVIPGATPGATESRQFLQGLCLMPRTGWGGLPQSTSPEHALSYLITTTERHSIILMGCGKTSSRIQAAAHRQGLLLDSPAPCSILLSQSHHQQQVQGTSRHRAQPWGTAGPPGTAGGLSPLAPLAVAAYLGA